MKGFRPGSELVIGIIIALAIILVAVLLLADAPPALAQVLYGSTTTITGGGTTTSSTTTTIIVPPDCQNGALDPGEVCDPSDSDHFYECTTNPFGHVCLPDCSGYSDTETCFWGCGSEIECHSKLPGDACLTDKLCNEQCLCVPAPLPSGVTWPVPGSPSPQNSKDQCFGWRPWTDKEGNKHCSFHSGIDVSVGEGTVIHAAAPGKVILSECLDGSGSPAGACTDTHPCPEKEGWGNTIIIEHQKEDGKKFYTLYAHIKQDGFKVSKGDFVTEGQEIGLSGGDDICKGSSTGPHFHFEIRDGGNSFKNIINPCQFFEDFCNEGDCGTECMKWKETSPACNQYKSEKC
jgi:hypothetical protein